MSDDLTGYPWIGDPLPSDRRMEFNAFEDARHRLVSLKASTPGRLGQ
ncbi:hypothetical protein POF50_033260 [Streptomyces sp. SL13]|uniref:Uncharacterized protein n=1 Tax=Streptantibioticus silvisoli TaxID=2705255 RepID=A0AA90KBV0_9ACTN|nr:hypothetical protein [Streptantibioticus silvisoli]MDI5974158.1 hypothetical protein [Streptantibioticus silvisoli]